MVTIWLFPVVTFVLLRLSDSAAAVKTPLAYGVAVYSFVPSCQM